MKNTSPRALATGFIVMTLMTLIGLSMAGCGTGVPNDIQVQQPTSSTTTKVVVVAGTQQVPDDISIFCVEGYAFLYTNQDIAYRGNPALARFPEMDARCK